MVRPRHVNQGNRETRQGERTPFRPDPEWADRPKSPNAYCVSQSIKAEASGVARARRDEAFDF